MSGYPDDFDRDRNDPDRGYRDDRGGGDPRDRDARDIRVAKSVVSVPAVGLIVTAALTILASIGGFIQLEMGMLDAQFDQQVKQLEGNPNAATRIRPIAGTCTIPLASRTSASSSRSRRPRRDGRSS